MKTTVLIDTYNHERFIERAITSVLEQDMPLDHVEILVVDDGSTDRTPDLARCFEPRVRYLPKPNGGQASAFNFGFAQAQGEIIAMLDGDDWWARNKLSRVMETLAAHPEIGMVGHGFYEEYADGREDGLILPGRAYRLHLVEGQDADVFRHVAAFFGTSRMTIRRSVIERILPVPEALRIEADEYIFTLAAALAPAMIINEPLCHYGIHAGNLFQFEKFDPAKARKKKEVLDVLLADLPRKLTEFGISQSAIDALLQGTHVEADRIRLSTEGGRPFEAFSVERAAFKVAYQSATWRYQLFRAFVLLQTLLLPPRLFYRLRRWYSEKKVSRLRSWTGQPVRPVQIVERRPG